MLQLSLERLHCHHQSCACCCKLLEGMPDLPYGNDLDTVYIQSQYEYYFRAERWSQNRCLYQLPRRWFCRRIKGMLQLSLERLHRYHESFARCCKLLEGMPDLPYRNYLDAVYI